MEDKKLKIAIKKRIETTMIGALASIEKHFGHVWGHPNVDNEELFAVYQELRQEILDKGNNQIRSLDGDFEPFEITKRKYHYQMPIRRQ